MNARSLQLFEPLPDAPCLCGSTRPFAFCCKAFYSDPSKTGWRNPNKTDRTPLDLLETTRHHIAWYRICHLAHTAPILKSGTDIAEKFLKMDIDALGELLEQLLRAYTLCGISSDFPHVIEVMKQAINDQRWTWKIRYIDALRLLTIDNNRSEAYKKVSNLKFKTCSDVELLTLFYDVANDYISIIDKVNICDRIVKLTKKEHYKFQYRIAKGVALFLADDAKEGILIGEEAINLYSKVKPEKKTFFGDLQFAHGLLIISELKNDRRLSKRAGDCFQKLALRAQEAELDTESLGEIYRFIGSARLNSGEFEEAILQLRKSLSLSDKEICRIFLARALCRLGQLDQARETLQEINIKNLNSSEHYDLGVSWSTLACETKTKFDIDKALAELNNAGHQDLFFSAKRLELSSELKALPIQPNQTVLRKMLAKLSRYADLKPNIFGLGININNIIDDTVGREHE